ncbi:hypothetical protein BSNT_08797 [Bacillus subtilis subsp. natto BEST195]|nr:hypothetical protein BSNT_08797 [Bacillus subtilis subsp. natto BEST195]
MDSLFHFAGALSYDFETVYLFQAVFSKGSRISG